MHIDKVEVEGVPPLVQEVSINCDDRVNLFIGPNASGKTTILRAMNGLPSQVVGCDDNFVISSLYTLDNEKMPMFCFLWVSDDWPRDDNKRLIPTELPVLYIPAIRMNLRGRDIFNFNQIMDGVEEQSSAPFEDLFDTDSGVFYGHYVELAIDRLREEMAPSPPHPGERGADWTLRGMINRGQQTQLRKAVEVGYSCAKSICPEVVHDAAPHLYIERDGYDENVEHYGMGIGTSDNILGEPLYAGALSSGTQGTLLWIWALALKMAHHYDWQEDWEKKPAILLIDEIENHLHPTWQRRIIPALLEHFPGLQIFATTHSPFVVAGLKAGQVHLLKRDENTGVVTSSTNTEDIIGWTADEILRTMMGVDEPTDQLTVDRANRLRELRGKDALTAEEQDELNTLRRQVNQTFLNKSSPLEAQRERYSELMQQFLLSRQSDLSQDGG